MERPDQKSHSGTTNGATLGQSSFTAHSFAIDFAHTVIGSNQLTSRGEVEILLDMLSHIRTAFHGRHDSSSRLKSIRTRTNSSIDIRAGRVSIKLIVISISIVLGYRVIEFLYFRIIA